MKVHTRETQATMTPQKSLEYLKEGNQRFQNNLKANRNSGRAEMCPENAGNV